MSVAISRFLPYPVREAFGKPGLAPTWSHAGKHGVGTALNDASKVWFTIANGIITEVFYPTVDVANTKDLRFYVTDSRTFCDEEGTDTVSQIEYIDDKAPAYIVTNTAKSGAYTITKRILTDPEANSLIIHTSFKALKGSLKDYRMFVQFAPHMKNRGYENSGRCATYNGSTYLIAWREDAAAVVTSDIPFQKMSAGFSGFSDGWHDLKDNLQMDWEFDAAFDGNIALTAEVSPISEFTVILSFGRDEVEAVLEANKTMTRSFRTIERDYIRGWNRYLNRLENLGKVSLDGGRRYWTSAMVLKAHEDKTYKGGFIASLSTPWGEIKGDRESVGYHLVWPRDLVKTAFAFIAMGDTATAVDTLKFLQSTQNPDGSWPQNMWINGRAYYESVQMDEVALPIILAWRLRKMDAVGNEFYPMAKRAASYLLKWGPVTEQERWEEQTGFSPSTLATAVSALVCAAQWARQEKETVDSDYLFSIADHWAANIDRWTYAECDCIGEQIPGHYLRIVQRTPETLSSEEQLCHALVFNRNRPSAPPMHQGAVVDAGFLDLARYGVRDTRDTRILSSIDVADRTIRFEYPGGAAFYRFNGDGYGEHEDGSPFDGSGAGRPWPLLTGERAMFETIAGKDASYYLKSLEGFANDGLLFPEQIWDRDDRPEARLFKGRGTGSATPLMWTHAEYVKVLRTKKDLEGCDIIPEVRQRYVEEKKELKLNAWKRSNPVDRADADGTMRIISFERANLLWTNDNWGTKSEVQMTETGFGLWHFDFKPRSLRQNSKLTFTFHYPDKDAWDGRDYEINLS